METLLTDDALSIEELLLTLSDDLLPVLTPQLFDTELFELVVLSDANRRVTSVLADDISETVGSAGAVEVLCRFFVEVEFESWVGVEM